MSAIADATIDFPLRRARVVGRASIDDLIAAVSASGFSANAALDSDGDAAAADISMSTGLPDEGSPGRPSVVMTMPASSPSLHADVAAAKASSAPTLVISVTNMRFMKNCGTKVQRALKALPGVTGEFVAVLGCFVAGQCGECRIRAMLLL